MRVWLETLARCLLEVLYACVWFETRGTAAQRSTAQRRSTAGKRHRQDASCRLRQQGTWEEQ